MAKPKVLIWDIETSPLLTWVWGLYAAKNGIPHGNIVADQMILCGAWKWLDQKRVHTVAVDPKEVSEYILKVAQGKKAKRPDRHVVEALREAVMEADFIVAHNGDKFDLKKLNARVIQMGLEPMPSIRTVDTLKEVRKVAAFTSNRLDYLSKTLLPDGGKIKTDMSLWTRIMFGEKKAMREMLAYNRRDVTELERVYLLLRPHMKSHPNVVVGDPRRHQTLMCPKCGSTHLQRRGTQKTQTQEYARYQCRGCGSWSSSRTVRTVAQKPSAGRHP